MPAAAAISIGLLGVAETLPPDAARKWAASVTLVALLGVVMVTALATIAVLNARRRRRARAERSAFGRARAADPTPDPWTESARRLQPERRPEPPEEFRFDDGPFDSDPNDDTMFD